MEEVTGGRKDSGRKRCRGMQRKGRRERGWRLRGRKVNTWRIIDG